MTHEEAYKILDLVTQEDIDGMFDSARKKITNWEAPSKLNPSVTKGKMFDDLCHVKVGQGIGWKLAIRNVLFEFGDYLPRTIEST